MFTGIIEKFARVSAVSDANRSRRLTLALGWPDLQLGQSIAVNGCCLTVAELAAHEVGFDIIKESLEKTNLGLLRVGDEVNIERSLRVGDRIDGHFVQGHVDGRAVLRGVVASPEESRLTLEAPPDLAKFIVPKGSVAIDGVSLTVASVKASHFEVALIPTTLRLTTLGKKQPGWPFNLETDVLSKTIVSWLEIQRGPQ
jgi:riboflavin synthase